MYEKITIFLKDCTIVIHIWQSWGCKIIDVKKKRNSNANSTSSLQSKVAIAESVDLLKAN